MVRGATTNPCNPEYHSYLACVRHATTKVPCIHVASYCISGHNATRYLRLTYAGRHATRVYHINCCTQSTYQHRMYLKQPMQCNGPCSDGAAVTRALGNDRGVCIPRCLGPLVVTIIVQLQHPYRDGRWARTAGCQGPRTKDWRPEFRGMVVL